MSIVAAFLIAVGVADLIRGDRPPRQAAGLLSVPVTVVVVISMFLADWCATETGRGPHGPASSRSRRKGMIVAVRRRSRQPALRACSLVAEAAEAITACTTSK